MSIVLVLLTAIVAGSALIIWWLAQLIHAIRTPTSTWTEADQNQLAHVLMLIFLGPIGALIYVATAKPLLRSVRTSGGPEPSLAS